MDTSSVVIKAMAGFVSGAILGGLSGCICFLPAYIIALFATDSPDWALAVSLVVPVLLTLLLAVGGCYQFIKRDVRRWVAETKAKDERRKAEANRRRQAEADRRQAEVDRRQAEVDRHKAEMERLKDILPKLLSRAMQCYHHLPKLVTRAETHLDQAEAEFADSAFAPFWDQIEQAAAALAEYHKEVENIEQHALEYKQGIAKLRIPMDPFPLPGGKLPDAYPAATRLASLVRKAQKTFEFAMIYEQRKMNQILVAGFGTLASAIYSLGDMISGSVTDLSSTLASLHCLQEMLTAESAAFQERSLEEQEEQTKMLDDIRRRRKPPW